VSNEAGTRNLVSRFAEAIADMLNACRYRPVRIGAEARAIGGAARKLELGHGRKAVALFDPTEDGASTGQNGRVELGALVVAGERKLEARQRMRRELGFDTRRVRLRHVEHDA